MNIDVLGAGAIGSIIAGHLAWADVDVTLLARGARAEYLKQQGITITGLDDFNNPCAIITDPKEISSADYLIVAVKIYQMVRSHLRKTPNARLELDLYGESGNSIVLLPGAGGGIRRFRHIGKELSSMGLQSSGYELPGCWRKHWCAGSLDHA